MASPSSSALSRLSLAPVRAPATPHPWNHHGAPSVRRLTPLPRPPASLGWLPPCPFGHPYFGRDPSHPATVRPAGAGSGTGVAQTPWHERRRGSSKTSMNRGGRSTFLLQAITGAQVAESCRLPVGRIHAETYVQRDPSIHQLR